MGERPKFADEAIEFARGFEVTLIVAFMGPIVRLSKGNINGTRFDGADGVFRGVTNEGVEDDVAPDGTAAFGHFGERVGHLKTACAVRNFPGAPDGTAGARGVENPCEDVPVQGGDDAPLERWF